MLAAGLGWKVQPRSKRVWGCFESAGQISLRGRDMAGQGSTYREGKSWKSGNQKGRKSKETCGEGREAGCYLQREYYICLFNI